MGPDDKDDLTMTQREQQQWKPVNGSTEWLSTLVNTFEQAEQLGDVRCNDKLLSELRTRLGRPALVRTSQHRLDDGAQETVGSSSDLSQGRGNRSAPRLTCRVVPAI